MTKKTTLTPGVRRRDPEKTRARILTAAAQLFSERGYSQTGLREISSLAGVSSALPVRYFGSKAGLFEAALHDALDMKNVLQADKGTFGKLMAETVLESDRPIAVPAMILLAIADDEAAKIAERFARQHIIAPVARWLGAPNGIARSQLIYTISSGFVVFNRHLILGGSKQTRAVTSAWLERTIQDIVDGRDPVLEGH